jgi:hypothetical protein
LDLSSHSLVDGGNRWPHRRHFITCSDFWTCCSILKTRGAEAVGRRASRFPCRLTIPSIIRIHVMVPIYSTVSFLSYFFYLHQIYYILPRDAYAAFALASFYSLLIAYAFRDSDELHQYLRTTTPKPWKTGWTLPIGLLRRCSGGEKGPFKTPRKASTWHNVSK